MYLNKFGLPIFSQVSIYTGEKSNVMKFATAGVDGQVIIWNLRVSISTVQN